MKPHNNKTGLTTTLKTIMFYYGIVCCLLFTVSITAQNPRSKLDSIASNFNAISEEPRTSIYLNTDKGIYETGEDIWFKGYVLLSRYLIPSAMSRTMYVELLQMPRKKPVWEERYIIENGFVDGHLYLEDSLPPGQYVLTAQTPYSINKDQMIIKSVRKVEIIQSISALQDDKTVDNTEPKPEEIDFSLMPESGHLVSGIQNKLAFKAVDREGKPQNISGTLYGGGRLC